MISFNLNSKWAWAEVGFRIFILIIFLITEKMHPFHRVIQPEEAWLYRFPNNPSIVPSSLLWVIVVIVTFIVISAVFLYNKDLKLALCGLGVPLLALPINGIITNIIKVSVGRPRPDYLNRCYGEQYLAVYDVTKPCTTNDENSILDGRKSFPSGHSSVSFCAFGFIFLYLAAQLKVFSSGRGRGYSLIISFLPLITATLIAISRTCDYHHHWQDITCGSILGFSVVFIIYRQYFPSLTDLACDKPDLNLFSGDLVSEDAVGSRPYGRRGGGLQLESPNCVKTV